jgi:hypothetical protein
MVFFFLLASLFLLPFVDPRRPFRLLHLDLLVLLGFGAYATRVVNRADVPVAAGLVDLGLLYLLGRMLAMGFRPRRSEQKLLPLVPVGSLAVVLALVLCVRLAYPAFGKAPVIDVGQAGVVGADRILKGRDVYGTDWFGNTYGPLVYLSYVPFDMVFPPGENSNFLAARAAAYAFDALTILGLFLVGRQLRAGRARG